MAKEIIVTDVDGVLFDSHEQMIATANARTGRAFKRNQWISMDWLLLEVQKITGESSGTIATWLYAESVVLAGKPFEFAQAYLQHFAKLGADMYAVTSRPPSQGRMTIQAVSKHFPIPASRVLVRENSTESGAEFKLRLILELNATQYLDDDAHIIEEALKLAISNPAVTSILPILIEQPWNNISALISHRFSWAQLLTQLD